MVDFEAFNKMKTQNRILAMALLLLLVIQPVMAYEVRSTLPAFNLWDVFVEYTFGNFWIAIIVIAILFSLMLQMGGISQMTTVVFLGSFFVSMAIGYGWALVSVVIFVSAATLTVWELFKWVSGGT